MEINSSTSPAAMSQTERSLQKVDASGGKVQQAESSVVSPTPKTQQETEKAVLNQVESVNSKLDQAEMGLTFLVDENTQSSVVKVIDKTTDEVIRQFPTEGSLKIMHNIQNYLNSVQETGLPTKEGLTGSLLNEII